MKNFDLETYHVAKANLQRTIEKAGDTGLARNASSILRSLEVQLETRVNGLITDAESTIFRLHRMLEDELAERVKPVDRE